jgi:hypothetical protein
MQKFTIIDVDLGYNVDQIINEDIVEITSKMKEDIDSAITVSKATQQVRDSKKIKEDKADHILNTLYEQLIDPQNIDHKLQLDHITKEIDGAIANVGAFVTRMKTLLRNKGGIYMILKKKINGEQCYCLEQIDEIK